MVRFGPDGLLLAGHRRSNERADVDRALGQQLCKPTCRPARRSLRQVGAEARNKPHEVQVLQLDNDWFAQQHRHGGGQMLDRSTRPERDREWSASVQHPSQIKLSRDDLALKLDSRGEFRLAPDRRKPSRVGELEHVILVSHYEAYI